jgi:hypothetical protein
MVLPVVMATHGTPMMGGAQPLNYQMQIARSL